MFREKRKVAQELVAQFIKYLIDASNSNLMKNTDHLLS